MTYFSQMADDGESPLTEEVRHHKILNLQESREKDERPPLQGIFRRGCADL